MAGIIAQVACTLRGGVVGWCISGAEGGGIGGGLVVSWRSSWHVGGFTGGALDDEMVGVALVLHLFAIIVSSSSSSLLRM
jgi:hypothetical protein